MAILFDNASNELKESNTPFPVVGPPMSIVMWFYVDEAVSGEFLMAAVQNSANSGNYFRMSNASSDFAVRVRGDVNPGDVFAGGTTVINTWHHGGLVTANTSDITAWLDASPGTPNTTTVSVTGANEISVGTNENNTANDWSGRVAEVAVYDIALVQDDFTNLFTNKHSPLLVQNANLKYYCRFAAASDIDEIASLGWANEVGGVTADHPPGIVYPSTSIISGGMIPQAFRRTVSVNAY